MPLTLPQNPAASNPGYSNFSASAQDSTSSSSTSTEPWQDVKTPDWLTTDPDKLMGELHDQYNNLNGDNPFNIAAYGKAMGKNIRTTQAAGEQAATNAAESYANRLGQSGATAFATGTVKAQNLLGTYAQVNDLKQQKQGTLLDAREKAATMAGNIANTMSSLRENYLGMLAGVTSNIANNNRTTTGVSSGNSLSATTAGSGSKSSGGAGGSNDFYSIIPNAAGKASGINPISYNSGTGNATVPTNPYG